MLPSCPNCHKTKGQFHPIVGLIPCVNCLRKQATLPRPGALADIVPDHIKQQRKEYNADIEQPFRKGEPNKKYIDLYGAERAKQVGMSEKEIKSAKYVYDKSDVRYYDDKT